MNPASDRLILALDVPNRERAAALMDACGDDLGWVKIGLELFIAEGPPVVAEAKARGKKIFLDLKLHDIPNTVAGAVRSAARMGVDLVTLHAEGGPAMMEAAVEARGAAGPRLLAVTVLTSLAGNEYPQVYVSDDVEARAGVFAVAAERAGVDGIVCSPHELEAVGKRVGSGFLRVTPGIRPAGTARQDQARVATASSALAAGATHLVVGRAVTQAGDPRSALLALFEEIAGARGVSS